VKEEAIFLFKKLNYKLQILYKSFIVLKIISSETRSRVFCRSLIQTYRFSFRL